MGLGQLREDQTVLTFLAIVFDRGDRGVVRHRGYGLGLISSDIFDLLQHATGYADRIPAILLQEDVAETVLLGRDHYHDV